MNSEGKSRKKIEAVILGNELPGDHQLWIDACREYPKSINYRVVDLTADNWLAEIRERHSDILLLKPGGISAREKKLYDERVKILNETHSYKVYPTLDEVLIYEDKRYFSYWCKTNNISHPLTYVFEEYADAIELFDRTGYPLVGKTSIGASGSGVTIISNREQALRYLERAFHGKGLGRRSGPDLSKDDIFRRGIKYLATPSTIWEKLRLYHLRAKEKQKGFVILQEFIPHDFEWRVVRIGNSFFAHKKLVKGSKASGSLLKRYDNPPLALLDFVKEITDRHSFYSQAIDIFETERGYLVNEMQCIFGQSDPYQMMVDGIPGRYLYKNDEWIFEAGDFARNQCYNLRVQWVIEMLR